MSNITYSLVGDYLLPNIVLCDPPDAEPLTKHGMMRKSFLKQHKPISYSRLLLTERLYPHCRKIEREARERMDVLMEQLAKRNPPPDKAVDGLAWAAHMNTLKRIAEEMVLSELIYSMPSC